MTDRLQYSKALKEIGNCVVYYPSIAKALGSVKTAIFACNFMYWEGKQSDKDRWIYKKQCEITEETALTRTEQEYARKTLKQLGILEEEKRDIPPKLYYRFDWDKLDEVLGDYFNGIKKEVKDKEPSTLYEMKTMFDAKFIELSEGIEFEWSKDKSGGKHWKGLKMLMTYFEKRIISRSETVDYEPTKEEILINWNAFIEAIPKFHLERNFTPMLLYSNINEIVKDIKSERNGTGKNNTKRDTTVSTASAYV